MFNDKNKTSLTISEKEEKNYAIKLKLLKILPEVNLVFLVLGVIAAMFTTVYLNQLNLTNYKSSEYLVRTTIQNTLCGVALHAEKFIHDSDIDITENKGLKTVGEYFMEQLSTTNINAKGFLYYQDICENENSKYGIGFNRNFIYENSDMEALSFFIVNGKQMRDYIGNKYSYDLSKEDIDLLTEIQEKNPALYKELEKKDIVKQGDLDKALSALERMKMMTPTELDEDNSYWVNKNGLKKYYRIAILPITGEYYNSETKIYRKLGFIITYDENDLWNKTEESVKLVEKIKVYFTVTIILLFLVICFLFCYIASIKNIRINRK